MYIDGSSGSVGAMCPCNTDDSSVRLILTTKKINPLDSGYTPYPSSPFDKLQKVPFRKSTPGRFPNFFFAYANMYEVDRNLARGAKIKLTIRVLHTRVIVSTHRRRQRGGS